MKIRLLLTEDHRVMRDGLKTLLDQQDCIEVVGTADDGRTSVKMASELGPRVVLMDIAMPELNGIEATRQITDKCPDTKVLILTMHSDSHFVMGAINAGASGYLLKDCFFEELLKAIRTVAAGKTFFSPDVAGNIISECMCGAGYEEKSTRKLTAREREVLQLLSEGKSSLQIAEILDLHERTIDVHRHKIMKKLDIHNVAGLTKYAVREGLTSL